MRLAITQNVDKWLSAYVHNLCREVGCGFFHAFNMLFCLLVSVQLLSVQLHLSTSQTVMLCGVYAYLLPIRHTGRSSIIVILFVFLWSSLLVTSSHCNTVSTYLNKTIPIFRYLSFVYPASWMNIFALNITCTRKKSLRKA